MNNKRTKTANVLVHLLLLIGAISMAAPFVWMILGSFKSLGEIFLYPPRWLPETWQWRNYIRIWEIAPFGRYYFNSFLISILGTVGQLATCSMAAYAFSRLNFRGRNTLFVILLMTLMLPYQLTVIPIFYVMFKIGWIDTLLPLIVPYFCGGAYGTFLFRQFFLTIPRDLDDAAKIDGCSPYKIYTRVYIPLSKPIMATLAVFTFMWRWNDLYGPLIFVHNPDKMTVTVGLSTLQGQFWTNIPLLMAGSLIALIPTMILYFTMQRYFIQGVILSGVKG